MGTPKHGVPRGEKSSYGQANASPAVNEGHKAKHRKAEPAGSDVPTRGSTEKKSGASRLRWPGKGRTD